MARPVSVAIAGEAHEPPTVPPPRATAPEPVAEHGLLLKYTPTLITSHKTPVRACACLVKTQERLLLTPHVICQESQL